MLIEETAIEAAALPLQAFRDHLRLGSGFAEADLQGPILETCLRAALAMIEGRTGKVLLERAFTWVMTEWRVEGQPLPVAPVQAIRSLTLRDPADGKEVIDAAHYRLEADMQRPVLRPAGAVLPLIPTGGTAELVFSAGMGDWAVLSRDLAQAVLMLAAHFYENRSGEAGEMPGDVAALIERYRTVRILGGRGDG